jgi:hypothetical protein
VRLARAAADVWVAKGKTFVHFDMRPTRSTGRDAKTSGIAPSPTDDELVRAMIGPSGNLRAPTIRCGKSLFVGFNAELFEQHLWG